MKVEDLAKEAYLAYGASTGNLNYQGLPMPTWEALPERIRTAWYASTQKILDFMTTPVKATEVGHVSVADSAGADSDCG